jgi:hypothetical protein
MNAVANLQLPRSGFSSTYNKLKSQLQDSVKIGIVQYVNYETEWIEENDPLLPFLYKRRSFEHEHEIRAIANLSNITTIDETITTTDIPKFGKFYPFKLENLIDIVYIAPEAPDWFFNLVQQEVKMYGFSFKVRKSSLEEQPFY